MNIHNVELEDVWNLRRKVMWPDKDLDFVKLEDDDAGYHFGLYAGETLVSVISLFLDKSEKNARFRKFATLEHEQGKGFGTALLRHTIAEAAKLGARRLTCSARVNKVAFYRKFGMKETGERFTREGIAYAFLELPLDA